MAAKKEPAVADENPVSKEETASSPRRFPDHVLAAIGSDEPSLRPWNMQEIQKILWLSPNLSSEERSAKIIDTLLAFYSIEPRDEFERMLAQQMIACHNATMECFRRAMGTEQPLSSWDKALKHAEKLSATYAKLLDTLNKHRGKGQQKVTVEHVHISTNSQTIIDSAEVRKQPSLLDNPRKIEPSSELPVAPPKVPVSRKN